MQRFQNKIVIVTGAARGMGKACAVAFAAEGARVALVDINQAELKATAAELESAESEVLSFPCDITHADNVQATIETVVEVWGQADILVNSAGILRTTTPLEEVTEAEWDAVLNVNLKGMFLFCRAVLPAMRQKRYGKIINIASSAGRSTSELGGAHYTVSKTGVLGLTRHIAREYGRYGINAVSVCPGLVDTAMIREQASSEKLEEWRKQIPLGRFAAPHEASGLILFLASDAAAYITGATIDFNGGSLLI